MTSADHGGVPVSEERELLVRLVDHLEASPRPAGWRARLRRAWEIRQAHGMLEWEDAREEGPACLTPVRNAMALAWGFMWTGSAISALILRDHPLAFVRTGLFLGLFALPLAAGLWYLYRLPARIWRDHERQYALYLDRARALPAPAGRLDPQATE